MPVKHPSSHTIKFGGLNWELIKAELAVGAVFDS